MLFVLLYCIISSFLSLCNLFLFTTAARTDLFVVRATNKLHVSTTFVKQ